MNRDEWMRAARALFTLMLETARTQAPVIVGVVELHEPHAPSRSGLPVCHGCDVCNGDVPAPEWPCRTFTVLAKDLLGIRSVDDHLERLVRGR